ncbi:MAG: PAS domain S-box protein [Desulfobacterales bacterium]|nr:PAS domain S-box protein [Desulfobacterales bacterium]
MNMAPDENQPTDTIKYFCPLTGLEIYTRPEWQSQKLDADYFANFWLIGDRIIYSRPEGHVSLQGVEASLALNEAVAAHVAGGSGHYLQIEDYLRLKNASIDARKYFIDHFNSKDRLLSLIFCNLSQLMKLAVKIGQRFALTGNKVFAVKRYRQAIEKALEVCKANELKPGDFIFDQPFKYGGEDKTLSPTELLTTPDWEFKTPDYCSKTVIIDRKILFSQPDGQLKAEHIPMVNKIHNSVKQQADFDYIVVDASKISGFSRKSRQLFMKYVLNWHREIPFRMYLLFGANPLVATAVKMARPFMPFAIAVADDINQAFEMIRADQKAAPKHPRTEDEAQQGLIQRYVDDLLLFIGSINWEKEGIDTDFEEIDPKHPFASVFNSIKLIKDELDDMSAKRRENELKIRESEEKYSKLFLYSNDGIFIHQTDGVILDVNNKALELFGYSKSEMLGLNVQDLHSSESQASSDAAFESLFSEGFVNFEIEFETQTGRRFPAEVSASAFELNGRQVIQGLVRDISQRKEAEAALRNYRTLVETMNDGVTIIDHQLYISYVNKALCRMSGYAAEEIIGRPAIEFLDEKNQQKLETEVANWPQSDTHVFEIDWIGKDERVLSTIVSPNPMFNEDGEFAGFLGILTDITDLNKARQEKDQIQTQLYHSQKMEAIGTLAGGVAHDFNNYLTTILGCAELMQLKKDEPAAREKYLHEIKNAADRSAALTRQLLAFSRRQILEKSAINLNQVVADMNKMLRRLIGENIELRTELAEDLSRINADPAQMEQIILNLVVNARDAMPEGGTLRIITENIHIDEFYSRQFAYARPGDFVCLTFEDNGCGMAPEVAENIFEPFFTTKVSSQGTGLGLSVVYGVIKQHGGWINVYSEPRHGTRFKIYLPVLEQSEETAEDKDLPDDMHAQPKNRGEGERILLVEDQDEVREMICSALLMNGYQVEATASVAEASQFIDQAKPGFDLLFSDVILPDGNGIELAQKIIQKTPGTRILLSSGYTEEKARIDIIEKNRFYFLQKPYPLERMLKKVREALDR